MEAKLRYNSEQDAFEVTVGEFSWTDEIDDQDDGVAILPDSSAPMCVALPHCALEGLKANTVYRLVEVPTELEPEGEIVDEDGQLLGGSEEDEEGGETELV